MSKKSHNNSNSGLKGVAQTVAQQEPSEMQYIEPRGQIFWFRRRIPEAVVSEIDQIFFGIAKVGKNGYLRLSLKTSDRREAIKKARKLAVLIDEAFDGIRHDLADAPSDVAFYAPSSPLTQEEIQFAAETMYATLLAADEDTAARSFAACLAGDDAEGIREPDRFVWSSAKLPPRSTAGQVELLKRFRHIFSFFAFRATGKTIHEATPDLLPFTDALRRYVAAIERRANTEDVPTPTLPTAKYSWTWDDAFDYYFKQRVGLADSTRGNYRTAWTALAKSAKCPPGKLTSEAVVTWRDNLFKELEPPTVKSRLTFAGAIWRESRVNGKIDRATIDPFEGLRVKVNGNAGSSREEFSLAELRKIFAAEPLKTARAVSIHAGYWLPLLALYHGARLEELTGLEVADLEEVHGYLVLHIRENAIRPRLKHRRKSERSFPVHHKLIELGFASYVEAAKAAGVEALFPSFTRGATFGEEFVAYVKMLIAPEPGRLVGMHCFRHNWETARREGRLDTSASNYITGRRIDEGSSALYGGPAGLGILNEELSKISYKLTFLTVPPVSSGELRAQDELRLRARRKVSLGI